MICFLEMRTVAINKRNCFNGPDAFQSLPPGSSHKHEENKQKIKLKLKIY